MAEQFNIPTEFKKIIVDMTKDILVSFPEQEPNMNEHLKNVTFETDTATLDTSLRFVFEFCRTVYPTKFFDILYQNKELFNNEKKEVLEFLPGIDFNILWHENISDNTRETLWKYLQLVLFTVVSSISDGNTFGDTAKLFEAINEDEFKNKLEETIANMHSFFGENKQSNTTEGNDTTEGLCPEKEGINLDDLPNPSDLHEHVSGMMNGKLGNLAREIAEETAADLNINMENAESINDVFKRLIKNPSKLMGLVKNVGAKLDSKLKAGDMKESELLAEAGELLKKMKNMPGMGDIQGMLNKMGMGGMAGMAGGGSGGSGGGKGKVNVSAMQANLERNLKQAKNRERLLAKLADNKAAAAAASAKEAVAAVTNMNPLPLPLPLQPSEMENLVFSTGEKAERSSRSEPASQKKKKNKNKK